MGLIHVIHFCTVGYAENSSKTTRRMQLVEIKGRKSGRKLTRRMIIKCKLFEYLQITHWDDSVLIMV